MTFAYKTFLSNICAIIAGHNGNEKTMIYCLKLCQKCLYLASLLFVFVALFAAIYQGVKRFLEYPTYTETTVVSQQNASFPAISFCATPNDYKEDVLKVNYIYHEGFIQEFTVLLLMFFLIVYALLWLILQHCRKTVFPQ